MDKTFGIIKPNSVAKNHIGKILAIAEENGLKIIRAQMATLTKKQAEDFYQEHKERPFYGSLCNFMTSGPVLLVAFEAPGAVEKWRTIMGATNPANAAPGTIRKLFADSMEANSVHGSANPEDAKRELQFFFKDL